LSYLSLKIFKDGQLIKTKIFTDDQISIGSSEGLSLQLEGLSPWHILIEKKHNIFCILDLNSETGTKLNGEELNDEAPISSGSKISAGPYELQFFIGPISNKEKGASPKPPVADTKQTQVSKKPIFKEGSSIFESSFISSLKSLIPLPKPFIS